jgi:hypothetical protein
MTALCIAVIVFEMVAAMRLLSTSRRYISVSGLLFAGGVEAAGALYLPLASKTYMWFWVAMQPCKAAFMLFACREIIARIPEHYGFSIRNVGRQKLSLAIHIAAALTVISSLIDAAVRRGHNLPVVSITLAGTRMCYSLVGIVVLLIARDVWLSRIRLSRNLVIHAGLFSLYVWTHVVLLLGRSLALTASNDMVALLSAVMLGTDMAICGAWVCFIRRRGEALPPKRHLTEAEEEFLEQRMKGLLDVSTRVTKR